MPEFSQQNGPWSYGIDLGDLRVLLAVIEHGSFTRAADAMGTSQPAVSQTIRRIEEHLGHAVVTRNRRGVLPTRSGTLLAEGARTAFDAIRQSVAAIEESQAEPVGRVVLGCHAGLASYALPRFMAEFLRDFPKVELTLWNGNSRAVEAAVLDGSVDMGLVVNPSGHPDTVITELFEDSVQIFHCFGSLDRRAALKRLETMPLIFVPELIQSQDILRRLKEDGIVFPRALPCSSLELVKSLVLGGVGFGILPKRVAHYGVGEPRPRGLPKRFPRYRDQIALVRRWDVGKTAAFRTTLERLRQLSGEPVN